MVLFRHQRLILGLSRYLSQVLYLGRLFFERSHDHGRHLPVSELEQKSRIRSCQVNGDNLSRRLDGCVGIEWGDVYRCDGNSSSSACGFVGPVCYWMQN